MTILGVQPANAAIGFIFGGYGLAEVTERVFGKKWANRVAAVAVLGMVALTTIAILNEV